MSLSSEANVLFCVCFNHIVGEKYILTGIDFPRIYKMFSNIFKSSEYSFSSFVKLCLFYILFPFKYLALLGKNSLNVK